MSETPERIEREMFEIRSQMSPDMGDLRKHIEPQVVAKQVKQTVRQRLQRVVEGIKANLKARQQEFIDSTKRQLSLVRKAGENRDAAPLTEAVKSDPRPAALLGVILVLTLLMVRKITGGQE